MAKKMPGDMGRSEKNGKVFVGGEPSPPKEALATPADAAARKRVRLTQIVPNPHQPRRDFDDGSIAALAESIHEQGLLHEILVRKVGAKYQIIDGERRFRALLRLRDEQKLGSESIHVLVRDDVDDFKSLILGYTANKHRRGLRFMEDARVLNRIIQYRVEQLGRRPTNDDLASFLDPCEETIRVVRKISDALADPEVERLSPTLGKYHKNLVVKVLTHTNDLQKREALRLIGEGASPREIKRALRVGSRGGSRKKPVIRRNMDAAGKSYDVTVRFRASMGIEELLETKEAMEQVLQDVNNAIAATPNEAA